MVEFSVCDHYAKKPDKKKPRTKPENFSRVTSLLVNAKKGLNGDSEE